MIEDPVLARLYFERFVGARAGAVGGARFSIWRSETPATRAWFVPGLEANKAGIVDDSSGDPRQILRVLHKAIPLAAESQRPEEWAILDRGGGARLGDRQAGCRPAVESRRIDQEKWRANVPEIRPAFRKARESIGWQCIAIPAAGRWTLRLEYEGGDVFAGLMISVIAWIGWMTVMLRPQFLTVWRGAAARIMRNEGGGRSRDDQDRSGAGRAPRATQRARELIQIMVGHPHAELTVATSRSDEEPRLEALHPSLAQEDESAVRAV